ncbi:response regulator transcription factor [Eisenbergiella sp.]
MQRLLIVDDEHYIVESLYELFVEQTDLDFEILTAFYGDEALAVLQSQKVDIVLLDINMPGLSGLQVAEQIAMNWPLCKIIFLTGYASFDYIYQTDKVKNASFLLKTEDNATIVRTVREAAAEIEKENEMRLLTDQSVQNQIHLQYLLHNEILSDFLNGRQLYELRSKIRFRQENFLFDLNAPVFLLYLKLKWLSPDACGVDYYNHIVRMLLFFRQNLNEKYKTALCDIDKNTMILFLQPEEGAGESLTVPHPIYLKECLNDQVSLLPPDTPYQMFLLILRQEVEWNRVGKSFHLLHYYFNNILLPEFPQYGRIVSVDEETLLLQKNQKDSLYTPIPKDLIQEINFNLQRGDGAKLNKCLNQANEYLNEVKSMHNLNGIRIYHEISNIYIEYLIQHHLEEKTALRIGLYKLYNLNQFDSWNDLISYYRELTDILLESSRDEEFNIKKQNLEQIKAYIHNNLNRSLTLNEIANAVNYNSSYISRYFKQMTGQSISQYIMQCKMEYAKKFLTSSDESIQRISEMLGFDSSQYFSIVFKKYTGLSPREYRVST